MELEFDIGAWVKEAREKGRLTQDALGERLGKTKGNISSWEKNRHEPSLKQMIQISAITGHKLPVEIGLSVAHQPAMNDARHADPDDLADLVRGFMVGTETERKGILQICRRALKRADKGGSQSTSD